MDNYKNSGVSKSTYYRRLREWTLVLTDDNGNKYLVNPKMAMKKEVPNE